VRVSIANATTTLRIALDGSTGQNRVMALKEVQREADEWIRKHTHGYFQPLMMLARMTEELGELSRAVSHHYGEKKPKPGEEMGSVGEEMADLLFVLVCMANATGIDLDDEWAGLKKKLYERDADRWKEV
jgi:NTP pyrophosphatase (non-canonical NTP hydrolase)